MAGAKKNVPSWPRQQRRTTHGTSSRQIVLEWLRKTSRDVLLSVGSRRLETCAKVVAKNVSRRKKDKSVLLLARLIIPRRDSGVAPVSTVVKAIYNAVYLSMLRLPGIIKLVEIASIAHNCHGACIPLTRLITPRRVLVLQNCRWQL